MGLARRMKTTGEVEILEGARKEAELMYLHNIVAIVEENKIPQTLIMNLDQTPLKYVPVSHHTMAKSRVKSVSIAGSCDKRCITGTFVITLEGEFYTCSLSTMTKQNKTCPNINFQSRSR